MPVLVTVVTNTDESVRIQFISKKHLNKKHTDHIYNWPVTEINVFGPRMRSENGTLSTFSAHSNPYPKPAQNTKKNNVFLKRKEKVYLGGGPVVKFSQNI